MLEKALLGVLLAPLGLLGLAFVLAHIADHWDAPEYPHSGFGPDCPAWDEAPAWEAGEAWGKGEPER